MKLSFTTAGCPGRSWRNIMALAEELAMKGVEIRGVGDEIYAPNIPEFSGENLEKTKAQLERSGICIPALDSTCALALPSASAAAMIEAKAYIDLASRLGAPYVRVMSTEKAQPTPGDLDLCAEQYEKICRYAEGKGVTPLMETNGILAKSSDMAAFMARIESENKGVLWDIHHPFRYFGEAPEETAKNIGPLVRHVHVKDSLKVGDEIKYKMMGHGDVPVFDAVRQLKAMGYDGFISLEWLKRWNPELEEPGIVFAHYKGFMDMIFNYDF